MICERERTEGGRKGKGQEGGRQGGRKEGCFEFPLLVCSLSRPESVPATFPARSVQGDKQELDVNLHVMMQEVEEKDAVPQENKKLRRPPMLDTP